MLLWSRTPLELRSGSMDPMDDLVWHYTGIEGLCGMIENQELWASHVQFMNDRKEFVIAYEALHRLVLRENPDASNPELMLDYALGLRESNTRKALRAGFQVGDRFICCASTEPDSLTMWRLYGRENLAFAVGMSRSAPLGILAPRHLARTGGEVLPSWPEVSYAAGDEYKEAQFFGHDIFEDLRNEIRSNDTFIFSGEAKEQISRAISILKHHAFSDENEVRVSATVSNYELVNYRRGQFGLTPYLKLTGAKEWGEVTDKPSPLPIRQIRLSPGATQADVSAVRALLRSHGLGVFEEVEEDKIWYGDTIDVWASSIPFRQ